MALRFISDLHLHESRPATAGALFNYLDNLPEDTEALYLLGDIFDAWVGDDDDLPFHQDIKQKLKTVSERGVPLFFMHGNRDFLIGKGFEMQTGCMLIPDPHVIEHAGQQYLLMHGDSLCTDDTEYQAFREQIRNPDMQAMLLAKPLKERREIARQLRMNSAAANSNKAEDIMDVNNEAVDAVMKAYQSDILIHGHTHRPAIHKLGNSRRRIVLGDWDAKGWELVIDNGNTMLNSFPIITTA